jgi:hypothetical protein
VRSYFYGACCGTRLCLQWFSACMAVRLNADLASGEWQARSQQQLGSAGRALGRPANVKD